MNSSGFKNFTDEKLLELIREDSYGAFDEVFNRYAERLFMYAAKVIKEEDESKDIVQEVLVSLWQRRHNLKTINSLSSYLHGSIRFKGLAYLRANLVRNNYLESLGIFFEEGRDVITENLNAAELEKIIQTEIDKLPPRMKEIFMMSRMEQLSHKEIAERLNISDQTVKKQINLSLRLFRLLLDERSGTLLTIVITKFLL